MGGGHGRAARWPGPRRSRRGGARASGIIGRRLRPSRGGGRWHDPQGSLGHAAPCCPEEHETFPMGLLRLAGRPLHTPSSVLSALPASPPSHTGDGRFGQVCPLPKVTRLGSDAAGMSLQVWSSHTSTLLPFPAAAAPQRCRLGRDADGGQDGARAASVGPRPGAASRAAGCSPGEGRSASRATGQPRGHHPNNMGGGGGVIGSGSIVCRSAPRPE